MRRFISFLRALFFICLSNAALKEKCGTCGEKSQCKLYYSIVARILVVVLASRVSKKLSFSFKFKIEAIFHGQTGTYCKIRSFRVLSLFFTVDPNLLTSFLDY